MQFIDPAHARQVLGRYRPRLVIDVAAADVQNLRLPGDWKIVRTVDHRFALNKPALVSAPSKKTLDQIRVLPQLPDLGVQSLQINARSGRFALVSVKDPRVAFEQLAFRLRDLVGWG